MKKGETLPFIVLFVEDKEWLVSRGYKIYKYNQKTGKLVFFSRLVDSDNQSKATFSLTRRLFRAEITHLYHFQHDNWMCIAKKALFRYNP